MYVIQIKLYPPNFIYLSKKIELIELKSVTPPKNARNFATYEDRL